MIRFADNHTAPLVRQMWKACFGDTDEYIDIYFTYKYKDENTLIYIEEGKVVASLQMLPYTITFYGSEIPFGYLSGLCTLPEYRNKGYMSQLINKAHQVLSDRGIALSILVPAEDWLYNYYQRFGYAKVFDSSSEEIPMKALISEYSDTNQAYQAFNNIYKNKDFCVQKSRIDFEAILKEYEADGCPVKTNLSGMACVIDAWTLLKHYAARNEHVKLTLEVQHDSTYLIRNGWVEAIDGLDGETQITKNMLCQLLFGYHTSQLENNLKCYFPEHHPIINLMLE